MLGTNTKAYAAALAAVFLAAFPAAAVELSIHNELKDYESGNLLSIEEARSFESPKSRFTVNIHPGKTVKVTKGNVSNFTLVRPFERHKLKYDVTCPSPTASELEVPNRVTVTLLQIHRDDLPAGCRVRRMGHWSRRTGIKWQELSKK